MQGGTESELRGGARYRKVNNFVNTFCHKKILLWVLQDCKKDWRSSLSRKFERTKCKQWSYCRLEKNSLLKKPTLSGMVAHTIYSHYKDTNDYSWTN